MGNLLQTTFLIIIGFSVLNLGLSLYFYINSKLKLHGLQAGFWASLVINFFVQGSAAEAKESIVILCFAFSIVPVTLLSMTSFLISEVKFPVKRYGLLNAVLIAITFPIMDSDLSFFWKALPISLAVGIPVFHASYILIKQGFLTKNPFQKLMALVLFCNGVNAINFALFRMEPGAQLWGWVTAYALYQLIAVFLPVLSLDFHNRTEKDRLKVMVDEKTFDLKQANTKLDSLNRQNSLLLKVVLHDISNSLLVVSYQVGKLKKNMKNSFENEEVVPEIMKKLEGRMEVLSDLVTQVREYESVKSGKSELSKDRVFVKEIKDELNIRFGDQMDTKSLNFNYVCSEDDFSLHVDRSSFYNSILSNLVSNAIKFSPIGAEIGISFSRVDQFNKVKVSNTGDPIPKELIEKLFSFEAKTNRVGTCGEKGTGFGLPILKEFVLLHGGYVEVESEGEAGSLSGSTTFTVAFPVVNLDPYEEEALKKSSSSKQRLAS